MESTSAEHQRDIPSWRERLAALGLTPSKALGQNFLHEIKVVQRIVGAAAIGPDDTVLEIGPGLGIMTEELAAQAERVTAVELDARLVEQLRATMPANVTVVQADALEVDPPALVGPDYVVVANLPYSVGTAVVRHLLEANPPARALTVMLQREVAERMAAKPPEMSLLGVGVQFYGAPRILFRVGGGAFYPPPKVESAVVRIETRPPPLPICQHAAFFRVVTSGFAQRRKQLLNTLSTGLRLPRDLVTAGLADAGIAPTHRPERLTVDDWVRVYSTLRERGAFA